MMKDADEAQEGLNDGFLRLFSDDTAKDRSGQGEMPGGTNTKQ